MVETLDLLKIPRDARITSRQTPHIAADAIIATTHPRPIVQEVPEWIVEWLRDAFGTGSSQEEFSRFVYIDRGDATKRRLLNEDACFTDILQPMGFEAYHLAKMPFASQIRLFAGADVIVGVHGAALTNLSFCKSGASVVELFAPSWRLRMFETIAHSRGLNYQAIVCTDDQTDRASNDPDFSVSVDELATKLQAAMVGKI